jgi:ribosomal protein S30
MYFKDLICYWPRTNIQRKVKKLEMPDKENWQRYKVRIFGYAGKF